MALKKTEVKAIITNEELSEMDKVKSILDLLHLEVDDLKTERDELQREVANIPELKNRISELEKQTVSDSEWKTMYEDMETQFNKYKGEQEAKATYEAKKSAYLELLKNAKVSDKAHSKALKLAELDNFELVDGKFKDAEKITESIKTEWADFVIDENKGGAPTPNPIGNGGAKVYTREDISKMSAEEINANWENIKKSLKN